MKGAHWGFEGGLMEQLLEQGLWVGASWNFQVFGAVSFGL